MGAISSPLRRDQALAFIIDRIVRSGICPTSREIGDALGVSDARAKELVDQLVERRLIDKVPGGVRNLRVRDVALCRSMLEQSLVRIGWTAAPAMGELPEAFPHRQLPMLPDFEHLPDLP